MWRRLRPWWAGRMARAGWSASSPQCGRRRWLCTNPSHPSHDTQVVVVGGGIGGLTCALALRRAGLKAVVVERAPKLSYSAGLGIGLWGPALRALHAIGLRDPLHDKGEWMLCAGYQSAAADGWLVAPSEQAAGDQNLTGCLCLRRGHLQRALAERWPEEHLILGKKVVSVHAGGNDVTCVLDDGSTIRSDFLVGADGLHSSVRAAMLGPVPLDDQGYLYMQGVCQRPRSQSEQAAFESWGPGGRFGVVPLQGDEAFWFAAIDRTTIPRSVYAPDASGGGSGSVGGPRPLDQAGRDWLRRRLSCFPGADAWVRDTPHVLATPIAQVPSLSEWARPRMALLGDAAHAVAPNLAQGACLAIEDAVELASLLRVAATRRPQGSEGAVHLTPGDIALYHERRRGRARTVATLSPMVHSIGRVDGVLRQVRDAWFRMWPAWVKTPVFNATHRAALGWQYTAPDLGQGLYSRVLGPSEFARLTDTLQGFHRGHSGGWALGSADVTGGANWMARLVARISGLPAEMEGGSVHLRVSVEPRTGVERWDRTFAAPACGTGGHEAVQEMRFVTEQSMSGDQLTERSGPLEFRFDMVPTSHGFEHRMAGLWLTAGARGPRVCPVPQMLAPRVLGTTEAKEEGGWRYDVEVRGPAWAEKWLGLGRLVRYRGEIDAVGDSCHSDPHTIGRSTPRSGGRLGSAAGSAAEQQRRSVSQTGPGPSSGFNSCGLGNAMPRGGVSSGPGRRSYSYRSCWGSRCTAPHIDSSRGAVPRSYASSASQRGDHGGGISTESSPDASVDSSGGAKVYSMNDPLVVAVVGGTGIFGTRVVRSLSADPNVRVLVCGRNGDKCQQLAHQCNQDLSSSARATVATDGISLDISQQGAFAGMLEDHRPHLVIHAAGPFVHDPDLPQEQRYWLAQECMAQGVSYLDFSDDRRWVCDIDDLDEQARDAGVFVIAGVSTVPAFSSVAVDWLRAQRPSLPLDTLSLHISPANRQPRGLSTVESVLRHLGSPIRRLKDGQWSPVHGWTGLRPVHLHGCRLPDRLTAWIDVPDLELFPRHCPWLRTVEFRAGVELRWMMLGLRLASALQAGLRRCGVPADTDRLAAILLPVSEWFSEFGSREGGMVIRLDYDGSGGSAGGSARSEQPASSVDDHSGGSPGGVEGCGVEMQLIALSGDGAQIPATPAIALTRRMARGQAVPPGARACWKEFSFHEFLGHLRGFDIHCLVNGEPVQAGE